MHDDWHNKNTEKTSLCKDGEKNENLGAAGKNVKSYKKPIYCELLYEIL